MSNDVLAALPFHRFSDARHQLKEVLNPTNLIYSDFFSELIDAAIYLKPENLQRTGSYKVRGAYYKIFNLSKEQKKRGLIAASAGNHAQGVAFAARALGVKATIVMPINTPLLKINKTRKLGAEVVLSGEVFDEAAAKALELAELHDYTYIPPFDDLDVIVGQGTIAFELLDELPEVDVILVPIGGGGLASGVARLAKLLKPSVKVIGVEPSGAASMKLSLEKGTVQSLPKVQTIADGVAVKTPGKLTYAVVSQCIDEIITVDDVNLIDSFLSMVEQHKLVCENAGLITVAALFKLKEQLKGKNVISIISGGNIDVLTINSLVQRGLYMRDRVFTFSADISDKPGELEHITGLIAREKGNIIRLEHDQFSILERFSEVSVTITIETYGSEHKAQIIQVLKDEGYRISLVERHYKES
ncbi:MULTISPECIES: threonine ammonia-lyase [unclassified Facklamia]|uniref:threonine ammonia-lyase n=1 Tax=Aerococcaceae TaxID=186827 RepID=UPI0013BE0661|nr:MULTISPECIES: threonine ammonia-lyase [unclassified Facklamia]NEW65171.1 threonine ammonia-lyase [Facklamia sp. 252]NEW68562.1 threonine ammonia-lyase [Facklamia sp. 253]QQD65974.1 threonine ammonia-lyase [Aerococcaceae bacterium zg-252]